jgi:uncharacterized protein (TIGR03118 family)
MKRLRSGRILGPGAVIIIAILGLGILLTRQAQTPALGGSYLQTNIVSDVKGTARLVDPKLINPWGIVSGPATPFWIADNNAGASTVYTGTGASFTGAPPAVSIPAPASSPANTGGAATGVVFNGTSGFVVGEGTAAGPSLFLFATEDGTIAGWNPSANPASAITAVDHSAEGAVYKGLAIAGTGSQAHLYAANFRENSIDVFDQSFQPVSRAGAFSDSAIPAGFAPFNIANLNDKLYVAYAKQNGQRHDDVAGAGNGFIDVFDFNGALLNRLVSRGGLNSPWGLVLAPSGFGKVGGDLLVGNFGDGKINAFDVVSGKSLGSLHDQHGKTLQIDELWGLAFGNGPNSGDANTLFFTAGIGGEKHGLFGSLQATPASTSGATNSGAGSSGYGY